MQNVATEQEKSNKTLALVFYKQLL